MRIRVDRKQAFLQNELPALDRSAAPLGRLACPERSRRANTFSKLRDASALTYLPQWPEVRHDEVLGAHTEPARDHGRI